MNVAYICRKFWPNTGGLAFHALRHCQHLQGRGHVVRAITRLSEKPYTEWTFFSRTEPERDYVTEGIPVHVMGLTRWDLFRLRPIWRVWSKPVMPRWAFWLVEWVFTPKFARLFRSGGYDLVHFDGSGHELWGYAALKAARQSGLPFLIQPSVHAGEWGDKPDDFLLFRKSDGVLTRSNEERDYLVRRSGVSQDRIYAVYCGIDDTRGGDGAGFRVRYHVAGPLVLFIGRKTLDKGYFLLHHAFERVVEQIPEARLVMLGPKRKDFREPVKEDAPWVIEIDDASEEEKRDALAACDVFCMPSRGESFGLGFMEAALCGKPSVGRNLAVLEDLLGQHGAALLVGERTETGAVELSTDELAKAIAQLLRDEARRRIMGEKARIQAERYLWPEIVKRFEGVYEQAVKG